MDFNRVSPRVCTLRKKVARKRIQNDNQRRGFLGYAGEAGENGFEKSVTASRDWRHKSGQPQSQQEL